jgi:hypothetical protein
LIIVEHWSLPALRLLYWLDKPFIGDLPIG